MNPTLPNAGKALSLTALFSDAEVAPTDVETRLHQTRAAMDVRLADRKITLSIVAERPDNQAHSFNLTLGNETCRVNLPEDLVGWLLETLDLEQDHAAQSNQPLQLALLIELACLDVVQTLERILEVPVRLGAGKSERYEIAVALEIAAKNSVFYAGLKLSEPLAEKLADHVEKLDPGPLQQQDARSVDVTLRAGCQYVTSRELADLAPGDIVMLEQGTASASLMGKVAVPVEAVPDGFRLGMAFLTGLHTGFESQPTPPGSLQIRAEYGSVSYELKLLETMAAGEVLPFSRSPRTPVSLVADGYLARGQIVELGEGLGVRIISVLHQTDRGLETPQ